MARAKKNTEFNFETALKELEEIVSTMEQGNLSLEDSLKLFERGVNLTRQCQQTLKESEQQVQILLKQNSTAGLEDFTDENSET